MGLAGTERVMMKGAGRAAGEVIKGILLTGFSIQIVLGIVWMCCNLAHVQDFAQAEAGIYPALVRPLGNAYPAVYALQLLAALGAGFRLLRRLGKGNWAALWGSLVLLTLPMAMQCHLALLPYSLVCSTGLLQLSFCCGQFFLRDLAGSCACYLVQVLLLPEYFFLGMVPVAVMLLVRLPMVLSERKAQNGDRKTDAKAGRQRGGLLMGSLLTAALFVLAAGGAYTIEHAAAKTAAENDISGNKISGNFISCIEWTLAKRVCWPTLWVDSDGMPDRILEAAGDVLWESNYYPENMDRYFKPALEAALSPEEAKPLLREMIVQAWEMHYPMIVRQVGWDVLGYWMTPVILPLQLSGDAYESHSGRNYEVMRNETPALTRRYVEYGCQWFAAALVLTLALAAARFWAGEKPYGRREGVLLAAALLFSGCSILWYTLQGAGVMDYKYTIFVNEMWFLWSLKTMGGRSRDGWEGQRI